MGVNDFHVDEPIEIPILRIDRDGEQRHLGRLKKLRAERDPEAASWSPPTLEDACAQEREHTMQYVLDAVRACCTLGEICNGTRRVFGEYRERIVV